MENQIICPCCQGTNIKKTTKGTATKVGAKVAGAGAGMAVKAAAKSAFGVKYVQTKMISNWVSSLPSIQHVCLDCYEMMNVKFDSEGNVVAVVKDTKYQDSEIQAEKDKVAKEKEEAYKKEKKGVTPRSVIAVLFAIYAVCCFNYPVAVVVGLILCFIFVCLAVSKNNKAGECKKKLEEIQKMPLKEFRYKFM